MLQQISLLEIMIVQWLPAQWLTLAFPMQSAELATNSQKMNTGFSKEVARLMPNANLTCGQRCVLFVVCCSAASEKQGLWTQLMHLMNLRGVNCRQ